MVLGIRRVLLVIEEDWIGIYVCFGTGRRC